MDTQTADFYHQHANDIASVYQTALGGIQRHFAQSFPPGCFVLDIGFGSGRDLKALLDAGYDAHGVEPCEKFIALAVEYFPALKGLVKKDALPDLKRIPKESYDGILCSAVLMHLPKELLFDSAYAIRRILKTGGRLLISIPVDSTIENNRDSKGRLFNGVTPENFQLIFERIGFRMISRWDDPDSLGREQRNWVVMLFVLESTDGSRSLDKIEGILNKDKKDATYKLALFRSLAEIAMTHYNSALWLPDGRIAISIQSISEKWLEYYWPIVESNRFIPQKRGEKPDCPKPMAFRKQLNVIIDLYRKRGGLAVFSTDYRNRRLTKEVQTKVKELFSKLRTTIIKGPVYYAGGGGSKNFEYDKKSASVVMDSNIWRELSIMGSWVLDATILRWAELTSEISGGEIRPSEIIDQLLVVPIPEREVFAVKRFYTDISDKVCVWSAKTIAAKFDVDHAIPYALWKNNDLWNLFPADPKINNQKRDKLPSHDLLCSRKDCIVYYWTLIHDNWKNRFEFEAAKFACHTAVKTSNWENRLFSALTEAIEITAIQRGISRWQPKDGLKPKKRYKKNGLETEMSLELPII
ncbi:MAG: class I SAM-dependent methyltransferase [Desulfobacteraceae bacterium]|jgi:SAM-dependent methyltransferase